VNTIGTTSTMECQENVWYPLPHSFTEHYHELKLFEKAVFFCNRRIVSTDENSEKLPIQFDPFLRKIRFNGISGYLNLGPLAVTIRPKFMEKENWIPRLSNALVLGGGTRRMVVLPGTMSSTWLNSRFIDPFARLYARSLLAALESHPLLAYQRIERTLPFVRGRVLWDKEYLKPPTRKHKVSCSFSGFLKDNEFIHLLRWASLEFHGMVRTRETRTALESVLERLPKTSCSDSFRFPLMRPLPPGMSLYKESFELAQELARARRRSASSSNSEKKICGVVAIMHACFEALVSHLYRRISPRIQMKTKAQSSWPFVRREGKGLGEDTRYVRPDDIILCSNGTEKPILVSDSKYVGRIASETQNRRHKLDAGNFYQVVCSCLSVGTRKGLIVQPLTEDVEANTPGFEKWCLMNGKDSGRDISIGVLRLDFRKLNSPDGIRSLENQLVDGIKQIRDDTTE